MDKQYGDMLLRFFLEDVGGNLITDETGSVLYEDARARAVRRDRTNWAAACPPPGAGQRGERWDLLVQDSGQTDQVVTTTERWGDRMLQLHHLADSSNYLQLFRDMGDYSRTLRDEKEHDGLTGLFNKGNFLP